MSNTESTNRDNPLRRDLPPSMVPQPCCVVLFGATGDLAQRKLVPALYGLAVEGFLPAGFTIVGAARREVSDDQFREQMRSAVNEHGRFKPVLPESWDDFAKSLFYQRVRFDDASDYQALARRLKTLAAERMTGGNCLYYLATAPEYFAPVAEHLHGAGLATAPQSQTWTRLVIEKPFGHDLDSATELNRRLQTAFDEIADLPYRPLPRQGNRPEHSGDALCQRDLRADLEPSLRGPCADYRGRTCGHGGSSGSILRHRRRHPRHASEPYDAGCSRWWRWNRRWAMDARSIRDEKVKVLRAIQPLVGPNAIGACVRGQYGPGQFRGKTAHTGYRQEKAVDPGVANRYLCRRATGDRYMAMVLACPSTSARASDCRNDSPKSPSSSVRRR